jgi:hypothetical protein
MIVIERGTLRVEAAATYNGDTGRRTSVTIDIYNVGPRGGKYRIWRGSPRQARDMIDLLYESIRECDSKAPMWAEWAPDKGEAA